MDFWERLSGVFLFVVVVDPVIVLSGVFFFAVPDEAEVSDTSLGGTSLSVGIGRKGIQVQVATFTNEN